jgi:hypothetical protein
MSLVELLRTKSGEYELLAEWHPSVPLSTTSTSSPCQAMAVVEIVLRARPGAGFLAQGGEATPGLPTSTVASRQRARRTRRRRSLATRACRRSSMKSPVIRRRVAGRR